MMKVVDDIACVFLCMYGFALDVLWSELSEFSKCWDEILIFIFCFISSSYIYEHHTTSHTIIIIILYHTSSLLAMSSQLRRLLITMNSYFDIRFVFDIHFFSSISMHRLVGCSPFSNVFYTCTRFPLTRAQRKQQQQQHTK